MASAKNAPRNTVVPHYAITKTSNKFCTATKLVVKVFSCAHKFPANLIHPVIIIISNKHSEFKFVKTSK